MDRMVDKVRRRCVIIHSNRLIAEDLKQTLLAEGADEVVISSKLADVAAGVDAVVFIEGDAREIPTQPSVAAWLALETPVVALDGSNGEAEVQPGVHILEQPFRSEHVIALLRQLKVF
ncbi:hypothetical protein HKCCE4037_13355 [Rhodobacterales bacterium HKCCE4037]|nr:hypothetical protein [Rhodobacterales bacterium HKCCE4037]